MLLYHVKVCTSLKIQNRRWLFFQLIMNAMPHDNTVHVLQLDHNLVNRVPLHDHTEHFKCYLKKHTSIGLPWWLSGEEPAYQCRALRHRFWSLIQEDPTCHRATKPKSHSYGAHGCNHGSPGVLGRCSTPKEATAMRSLGTKLESSPCSLQLEKSPHSNEDPAQPKIHTYIKSLLKNQHVYS